ncbi:MAG: hypothetical protein R3C26_26410 [Calditrichia bacterium]
MKVRVYAIGEGTGGDMYDYGWITDATNHERVWEMNYRDTDHAGGNGKNRLSDEVIDLKRQLHGAFRDRWLPLLA